MVMLEMINTCAPGVIHQKYGDVCLLCKAPPSGPEPASFGTEQTQQLCCDADAKDPAWEICDCVLPLEAPLPGTIWTWACCDYCCLAKHTPELQLVSFVTAQAQQLCCHPITVVWQNIPLSWLASSLHKHISFAVIQTPILHSGQPVFHVMHLGQQ